MLSFVIFFLSSVHFFFSDSLLWQGGEGGKEINNPFSFFLFSLHAPRRVRRCRCHGACIVLSARLSRRRFQMRRELDRELSLFDLGNKPIQNLMLFRKLWRRFPLALELFEETFNAREGTFISFSCSRLQATRLKEPREAPKAPIQLE